MAIKVIKVTGSQANEQAITQGSWASCLAIIKQVDCFKGPLGSQFKELGEHGDGGGDGANEPLGLKDSIVIKAIGRQGHITKVIEGYKIEQGGLQNIREEQFVKRVTLIKESQFKRAIMAKISEHLLAFQLHSIQLSLKLFQLERTQCSSHNELKERIRFSTQCHSNQSL